MFAKLFLVLVAVALIAQSTEARKKKTTTTTAAPTTTTTLAPAPVAITTIWEDKENIGLTLGGIERMLGANTRRIFDKIGYKYNTKQILEYNIGYLLNSDWTTNYSQEESLNRYLLQQVVANLHPLSRYVY